MGAYINFINYNDFVEACCLYDPTTLYSISNDWLIVTTDDDTSYRFQIERTPELEPYVDGFMIEFTEYFMRIVDVADEFRQIFQQEYLVSLNDIAECPVCMESFEPMWVGRCKHDVCDGCMIKMEEAGLHRCPLCRDAGFRIPMALACGRDYVEVAN